MKRIDWDRRRFLVTLAAAAGGGACTLLITRCDGLWGEEALLLDVVDLLTFPEEAQIVGGALTERAIRQGDGDFVALAGIAHVNLTENLKRCVTGGGTRQ